MHNENKMVARVRVSTFGCQFPETPTQVPIVRQMHTSGISSLLKAIFTFFQVSLWDRRSYFDSDLYCETFFT